MQTRHRNPFTTVRTEGALLPADFLARITEGDQAIAGLTPEAYHLLPGEKLNEAINRSWNRLLGAWTSFRSALDKLPPNDPATSVTRERWLLPTFQELGYGRLQAAKTAEIDGKSYPISHTWQQTPVHLVGCGAPLDRPTAGVAGAARTSPHSLVQDFLNRSDHHLWGFVSNGYRMRILRDNISLTRQAYVEFDLESMMDGEVYADFVVLWLLCHQSRVETERPDQCYLERWSRAARDHGTRALDQLRVGVEDAITALGRGFLDHPANGRLRDKLRSGELVAQDYYRQLLRTVYRLLFLFAAEDRELLLDPHGSPEAKKRYTEWYSTARLRRLAARRLGTKHGDLWKALVLIFRKLGDEHGCPKLALPPLNSFLWSGEAAPDLGVCDIENRSLLDAVRALAFTVDKNVRRAVDYRNLGTEELGSIYESLLELHPVINGKEASFRLSTAGGHERKTTGSYYTPASLISCLLDSALEPVLDEATRKPDPERALLNLKVCDPACGSGHFLIAAAHRIAKRLATVRTGDEEPAPEALRKALRYVIGHCLYGVDINPMAVELCKVSLWMEALEPGKPLSFLEHKIQCGNSLLGATPALLEKGIPDDAFKPIEGDDKKLCTSYRKRNKDERQGQQDMFARFDEPWSRLGDLATSILNLERIEDNTIQGICEKQQRYAELVRSAGYLYGRLWADAWCSAFVWKKVHDPKVSYAITEQVFRQIEKSPFAIPTWMRDEIQRLSAQYQFFHWHLAFPDVFRVPAAGEQPENEQHGWSGGFDVVLDNPPWERIKLQEKEWFAERRPDIATAPNAAARKRLIDALKATDFALYRQFLKDSRRAEGEGHILRNSGRYPLCGRGDINVYAVFAEGMRNLVNVEGRIGCVLPSGIATGDTTKLFFQDLMERHSLVSLFSFFEIRQLFVATDSREPFCLITMGSPARALVQETDFVFSAKSVEDLHDPDKHFILSSKEIARLNPNTRTCPVFSSNRDAELIKGIYRRVPVLIRDPQGDRAEENPWELQIRRVFDMNKPEILALCANDNLHSEEHREWLPMMEAKLVHQFDHRFSSYSGQSATELSTNQKADPSIITKPRYWISESEVKGRLSQFWNRKWLFVWRDICRSTDERTAIAAAIPSRGTDFTLRVGFPGFEDDRTRVCLIANWNAIPFDYCVRQQMGGTHLSDYITKQLPVIPPHVFLGSCPWDSARKVLPDWLVPRVLELSFTAWDLRSLARDCAWAGPPFCWDEERRFLIRCELDAAFFHLYLPTRADGNWLPGEGETTAELDRLTTSFPMPRDAVAYIMEAFPSVRRKDEQKNDGDYRTKRVILEVYDAMAEAIRTGRPYETILAPPPADPSVAHEPR